MGSRIYSFVVDSHGEFLWQAQKLVWSLVHLAQVPPHQIAMHVVGDPDPASREVIDGMGVHVVHVAPFPGHPWCNKLQQLSPLLQFEEADEFVLLDCDIVVTEVPPAGDGSVLAKPVDTGNPPNRILAPLFSEAGLEMLPARSTTTDEPTVRGNANGGVYVIPRNHLTVLAQEWPRWAQWCLERKSRFEDKWMHVDQVSFAMALASAGIPFREMSEAYNFPTHLQSGASNRPPGKVLHYHRSVDALFRLSPVGNAPETNALIDRVNHAWQQHLQSLPLGCAYWNAVWKLRREIGWSQIPQSLEIKQACLEFAVDVIGAGAVLDVGCGDGDVAAAVSDRCQMHGADYAAESRAPYMAAIHGAQWSLQDLRQPLPDELPPLVACLDVLSLAASKDDYAAMVRHLAAARAVLLVSGFDAAPAMLDPGERFHESLSVSLQRLGRVCIPLHSYQGRTVFFCPAPGAQGHPRDLQLPSLEAAVPLVENKLLLLEAIYQSRRRLGFFPDHVPRLIEYPWIIDNLPVAQGLRAIDAGAGVSVLPLLMADRGFDVITVDSSTMLRDGQDPQHWNEWGYLNYQPLHARIQSFNQSYESLALEQPVHVVVSVSVIEHLPRPVRLQWLQAAKRQLVRGGIMLLTVDTVPHSPDLWNYAAGEIVDAPGMHGTVRDLEAEVQEAGFTILKFEHIAWLPQTRVGMARIMAQSNP